MYRMPKQEIIDRLVTDLAVDRYLTDDQLFRRYELGVYATKALKSAKIIRTTRTYLRPTYGARMPMPVTIISSGRSRKDPLAVIGMEHYLGLAELRWALRNRVRYWRPAVGATGNPHYFDVVAFDDQGELLIEYVTGWHTTERLLRKADVARRMSRRQLWASSSGARIAAFLDLFPDAEVWLVRWYDGTSCRVRPGSR